MEKTTSVEEVLIEETFNASIERVFSAWTDPEKLMQWYAPEGCTITFKKLDIRKGGSFHSCITHPVHGACWAIGEYLDIQPNKKIVFTLLNADENGEPVNPADIGMDADWPRQTLVTVTFSEENGQTKLVLRQTVAQQLAKKTGAYPSWLQMLQHMRAIVE
ncbi:SRPBCC domain-containing protein [Chitinophaga sp. Cy-1792]|uniref:SRPBCC family protein n=1 Tax=Chitinophaga sp. Cy-1792 TaxID=2608339 RepID=UPI0014222622|nr:SRPBCC domain-containing protein [Chitinophaga sp. Cy-1792]NIG55896.1 SRPBCC domain-containing protein [Chitinophaga sp. Cy-1792]